MTGFDPVGVRLKLWVAGELARKATPLLKTQSYIEERKPGMTIFHK